MNRRAQRGGIANSKRDALVAEQEVRSIQAVTGDPRGEGALVFDRRAALQAGPVHVDDWNALRLSHLRAAIVEREQVHLASGVAQPLRHGNPEPGLIRGERRDQDGFGRTVMRARGIFRWRCWRAACRCFRTARAFGEQRRVAPVVNGDPLEQAATEAGSIRLSRRAGLTQVRSVLGNGRSQQQARGALGDLPGARVRPGAPDRAGKRHKGIAADGRRRPEHRRRARRPSPSLR